MACMGDCVCYGISSGVTALVSRAASGFHGVRGAVDVGIRVVGVSSCACSHFSDGAGL